MCSREKIKTLGKSFAGIRHAHSSRFCWPGKSPAQPLEDKPYGRQYEQRYRNHHDHEPDDSQEYLRPGVHSIAERGFEVVKKSARRCRDDLSGRVQSDVDGRKRRLIFEEAATAFELFDLGADIGELSLDFERVRNFSRLLHDLQELGFERTLRADARLQINIFFGHVLT